MKIIAWQHKANRSFWFRIFGYGLNIINRETHPAPFSIRYGYRKEIRIGRWGIHVLTRSQLSGKPHGRG